MSTAFAINLNWPGRRPRLKQFDELRCHLTNTLLRFSDPLC